MLQVSTSTRRMPSSSCFLLLLLPLLLFALSLVRAGRNSQLSTFRIEDFKISLDKKRHDNIVSEAIYLLRRNFIHRDMYSDSDWAQMQTEYEKHDDKRSAVHSLMRRLDDPYAYFILPEPMRVRTQQVRGTSIGLGISLKRGIYPGELGFALSHAVRRHLLMLPQLQLQLPRLLKEHNNLRSSNTTVTATADKKCGKGNINININTLNAKSNINNPNTNCNNFNSNTNNNNNNRVMRLLSHLLHRRESSHISTKEENAGLLLLRNITAAKNPSRILLVPSYPSPSPSPSPSSPSLSNMLSPRSARGALIKAAYVVSAGATIRHFSQLTPVQQRGLCACYAALALTALAREVFPLVCPVEVRWLPLFSPSHWVSFPSVNCQHSCLSEGVACLSEVVCRLQRAGKPRSANWPTYFLIQACQR